MKNQKGITSILLIVVVVLIILIVIGFVIFLFQRFSKKTDLVQLNNSTQTEVSESNGSVTNSGDAPSQTNESQPVSSIASNMPSTPATQKTTDPYSNQSQTYTNTNFKFSLVHPDDFKFEESSRNYFNIETNEDPNERVYLFNWTKNGVTAVGNVESERIQLSVYTEGYEPYYRIDKNSKEDLIKIDGQNTKKRYGNGGKIITVGPISHNGKVLVFQYELSNPASDQSIFDNLLNSIKLLP
jgi:type II secretory pathway pseudopilin PulG